MSKPTANEDDPRAQPAAVGAWDNYVDPHPDGDKPRPRELPRHRLLRRHTPAAAEMRKQQDCRDAETTKPMILCLQILNLGPCFVKFCLYIEPDLSFR